MRQTELRLAIRLSHPAFIITREQTLFMICRYVYSFMTSFRPTNDSSLGLRIILVLRSTNDLMQQRAREHSENVYESPTMFDFSKTSIIQSSYLVEWPNNNVAIVRSKLKITVAENCFQTRVADFFIQSQSSSGMFIFFKISFLSHNE